MRDPRTVDAALVTWGDRLFYPGNRMVRGREANLARAATVRRRIETAISRRAPQVMVKVTGGGRAVNAIAAHFRYISKNGRLEMEDQRRDLVVGRDGVRELVEEWKFGGALIEDRSGPGHRREAFNIMLSMPRGTDPICVRRAAGEFCRIEFSDHKFVMVLHDHQANPHVHVSVRAEGATGKRLNPRKADLQRWRETFAERLRGYGIEAEATSRATRCESRRFEMLWRMKAKEGGRLRHGVIAEQHAGTRGQSSKSQVIEAWDQLKCALAASPVLADRELAKRIDGFLADKLRGRARAQEPARQLERGR